MNEPSQAKPPARLQPPPGVIARRRDALWLDQDGELQDISHAEAGRRARENPPLVVHGPATAARLGIERFPCFDLLDLFAFVRPARFCIPTPAGLLQALALDAGREDADHVAQMPEAARILLRDMVALEGRERRRVALLATTMGKAGWPWARSILATLGSSDLPSSGPFGGLDIWNQITEWSDYAPLPPPGHSPVEGHEARERLAQMLGGSAEQRPQQADFAATASAAFLPRELADQPRVVLAEAGTGTGKTLGYIAPATLWAEKNGGTVWVSTYTKNLQRQVDQELARLYPDALERATKVVIRKGRENYLCLLNLEEAAQGGAARPQDMIALGLVARWAGATRDGDLDGGDFPSWLADLHGAGRTRGLADRRGECIHSACAHFRKCFIERSVRKARRADLVIANHALVMIQAATSEDVAELPARYVFDEGHHLFDAADSTFSAHLSAAEGHELRRWFLGPEGGRRSRGRGLERRAGDLFAGDEPCLAALGDILESARALPGEGWPQRLASNEPRNAAERFIALVRQQVLARAADPDSPYALECPSGDPVDGLLAAAEGLKMLLLRLYDAVERLTKRLATRLDEEASDLDTQTRQRMEAVARGLKRRSDTVRSWASMLEDLARGTPERYVDWFSIDRDDGRETDVGFHRHWVDPTRPFIETVLKPAQGALITSATLRDSAANDENDWRAAETRTGAIHLPAPARRASHPSPFDYGAKTRVLIVTDVRRDDMGQIGSAYRELFLASGGGGLGLFTAISRLRAVHKRIARPLEDAGLSLLAQHVDPMDNATLVDIFRADENSCLLGTDAMRDGVDVPGRALRLVVFDRVPWPRPDIMHKARRAAFGAKEYDDRITRLRIKQAFGRLLRRSDDRGVFVILDAMFPSRLFSAFPAEVEPVRLGLRDALGTVRDFLAP